jgi:hypothetical protein
VIPKPDVTAVDAKVKDDGQPVDKTEEFMSIIDRKTRREKRESSCRAKVFPLLYVYGLFAACVLWH